MDYQNYIRSVDEQERTRKEWDEESDKLREEKEKLGEHYQHEERTWPIIKQKPFLSKSRKYVVSMDTLG